MRSGSSARRASSTRRAFLSSVTTSAGFPASGSSFFSSHDPHDPHLSSHLIVCICLRLRRAIPGPAITFPLLVGFHRTHKRPPPQYKPGFGPDHPNPRITAHEQTTEAPVRVTGCGLPRLFLPLHFLVCHVCKDRRSCTIIRYCNPIPFHLSKITSAFRVSKQ